MDKRFLLFLLLSALLIFANALYLAKFGPQPKQPEGGKEPKLVAPAEDPLAPVAIEAPPEEPEGPAAPQIAAAPNAKPNQTPQAWYTLGSLDPDLKKNPYRMLAIVTNKGAAIEIVEMSSLRYLDLQDRIDERGYFGWLALTQADGDGVKVGAVGAGTPAKEAGLLVGDVITSIRETANSKTSELRPINTMADWLLFARHARVRDTVTVSVQRDGKKLALKPAPLRPTPLALIQPQRMGDSAFGPEEPLSMLMTLAGVGEDERIPRSLGIEIAAADDGGALITSVAPNGPAAKARLLRGDVIEQVDGTEIKQPSDLNELLNKAPAGAWFDLQVRRKDRTNREIVRLPAEMPGVDLHTANWEAKRLGPDAIEFRHLVESRQLEFVKRYRLAHTVPASPDDPAYHMSLELEVINHGQKRTLAYQMDGPNGLPTEGWWYGNKISRSWSGAGTRDVGFQYEGHDAELIGCLAIASNDVEPVRSDEPLNYVAADARYFSAALIPDKANRKFQELRPVRVGVPPEEKKRRKTTNTSFRLISQPATLNTGEALKHSFKLFLGPKKPALLAKEDPKLQQLVYYGWFGWVAEPMLWFLHFGYGIVGNYGIAIIMLTVVVRAMMFPLSMKQALNAQKMQELQPEIKRINEKYKKNYEQRSKATQELFRKNKYNPLGGCLLMFVQLPVFIGLYRGLTVDVSLRQEPLIPGLDWCSNLAAPDMLFRWKGIVPDFLGSETGWLGPYFNLLPIITIVLFLMHQKLFMPPPTDEQSAMQQKMMKYMMIFFGVMFFCVPSGLCLYFIASSLWGITERKLLPRFTGKHASAATASEGGPQKKTTEPGRRKRQGRKALRRQRRQRTFAAAEKEGQRAPLRRPAGRLLAPAGRSRRRFAPASNDAAISFVRRSLQIAGEFIEQEDLHARVLALFARIDVERDRLKLRGLAQADAAGLDTPGD